MADIFPIDEKRKKISYLSKLSVLLKWNKDSEALINHMCVFCNDVKDNNKNLHCDLCMCPSEICKDHGEEGMIKELVDKYGENARVCDIKGEDLEKVQEIFKKYFIN